MTERLLDRRDVLRTAGLLAAGAVWGGAAPMVARAVEPIARNGRPKFKFSLAAYSYRDLLKGKDGSAPELTLDEFIADCAKFGLEGTELTSYYFPTHITGEYLRHLKQLTFRLGLDISGTSTANDFCLPPGPKRDEQLAHCKLWVDYAETMGAPVIRVFSGKPQKEQDADEAHKLAVEGLEECCDYAGQHGVFLALENHGGLTTKPDDMLRIVHDVKSPWFGVNLDTGNFRTEDPYEDLAKIAPYALNVQIKVSIAAEGEKRELAIAGTPQTHADKSDPPFLTIHGDKDRLVPISQSEELHAALKKAGVESELFIVKGGGHGIGIFNKETSNKVNTFWDRHLKAKANP